MKRITLCGHQTAFREAGSGDPVILVHGWTGSSYDWTRLMPLLAENHRVIAHDQTGFGKSAKPKINYRLATFTGLIDALADALEIPRFHLVGNSMGGHIAAAYCLERPGRVRSLALLDSAGVREGAPRAFAVGRYPRAVYSLLRINPLRLFAFYYRRLGPYYDSSFLTPQDILQHYHSYGNSAGAYAAAQCFRHIIFEREAQLDQRLADIKTPTLVVWGGNDQLLPLRMGKAFAREIPGALLKIIPECGHCPQEEKPEELRGMLEEFWKIS